MSEPRPRYKFMDDRAVAILACAACHSSSGTMRRCGAGTCTSTRSSGRSLTRCWPHRSRFFVWFHTISPR